MKPDISTVPDISTILSDLVTVTNRLTRVAAHATGETTNPASWRTLSVLVSEGPMRLGELASLSRVSQPTMTKLVAHLNELEWIKRIADTTDARAWQIAIAPKGTQALDAWRHRLATAMAPLFDNLTPRQLQVLAEATDLIGERISKQEMAA